MSTGKCQFFGHSESNFAPSTYSQFSKLGLSLLVFLMSSFSVAKNVNAEAVNLKQLASQLSDGCSPEISPVEQIVFDDSGEGSRPSEDLPNPDEVESAVAMPIYKIQIKGQCSARDQRLLLQIRTGKR